MRRPLSLAPPSSPARSTDCSSRPALLPDSRSFDQIVYPAYVLAHLAIFAPADAPVQAYDPAAAASHVELAPARAKWTDPPSEGGKGLVVLPVGEGEAGMGEALRVAVEAVARALAGSPKAG